MIDAALFVAAAITLGGYVCRLDALHWSQHRALFVLLHLSNAGVCAWVLTQAASGGATVGCWLGLLAAALWLVVSYHSWRNGPPAHACRVTVRS